MLQQPLPFRRRRIAQAALLAALSLAAASTTALAQGVNPETRRHVEIAAGTLDSALNRFAGSTGILLAIDGKLTAGKTSQGLRGDYTPQEGLAILLQGTGLEAVSQADGAYALRKAVATQSTMLPEVVAISEEDSSPASRVLINGARSEPALAGGRIARSGGLGVLGMADVMDTPFSTTNYTAQILEDQQARTLADVVVNEASVRTMTSTGGFSEDFQIRGFNVTSGDVGLNGLYGLASSNRMPTAFMERVEVLKGPGTLMYGISPNGSIGGNINIVTKRAKDQPITRLTTTYESKSLLGGQLDVGRRFGESNAWGLRFNGVYRNGDTNIDNGQQQFGMAALALDYRASNVRWSVDAYAQREHTDNFRAQIGFRPGITRLPAAPSGHRAIYEGADLKIRDATMASRLEYDWSPQVMLYAAAGYHYGASEQDFPSARGMDAMDEQGNIRVSSAWYDAASRSKTGEAGVRARFETQGIPHVLSFSASRLEQEAGSFYLAAPAGTAVDSNIYAPLPVYQLSGDRFSPSKNSATQLTSMSLTDTLSFADKRILLTAGLRQQKVQAQNFNAAGAVTTSYGESAVSPIAGVVVRPWDDVSVYGNFTSGLTRGSTAPLGTANVGEVFAPFKSKQYEIGLKVDRNKVITGVSLFQIDRPNAITDPISNIYSMDGKQRNRGLELSAVGEAVRDLRLMASATFYDAKLQRAAGGLNQGNDAIGVPKHTLNLGADWDVPGINGLTLNARAIYTAATPYDVANTLEMPSWQRYDIGARYRTTILRTPVVLRASVENVFNKRYWLSSSTLLTVSTAAAPRTALLSAQFDL
ncbi:TonB-dependent siderophore receptor [Janthinobacterium sp. Mn2066]|uniref:TonB-dependent siderophore receptor n=1 Tax=Janthinobacterium sp. Mn2066 TaxID=3395264 RepID=UPI003BD5AC06